MRKIMYALLLMAVTFGMGIIASSFISTEVVQDANIFSTGIGYSSMVCVYKNGEAVSCKPNLFTSIGKNITRDALLYPRAVSNATTISVGNNTSPQAQGDTSLQGDYSKSSNICGLTNGTGSIVSDALVGVSGNWSISKVFTSTCDSVIVNATGLYNSTVGGLLFAQANFTSVTLQNQDQINVTWYIWVS